MPLCLFERNSNSVIFQVDFELIFFRSGLPPVSLLLSNRPHFLSSISLYISARPNSPFESPIIYFLQQKQGKITWILQPLAKYTLRRSLFPKNRRHSSHTENKLTSSLPSPHGYFTFHRKLVCIYRYVQTSIDQAVSRAFVSAHFFLAFALTYTRRFIPVGGLMSSRLR